MSVPRLPQIQQQPSLSADLSLPNVSTACHYSAFLFLGRRRKDVDKAKEKLKDVYKTQCSTHTFKKDELEVLTKEDMLDLQKLMDSEGLYMLDESSGNVTVTGLKDGVNKVIVMINEFLHGALKQQLRVKEEDELYPHVAWCIQGQCEQSERLPKKANYSLEKGEIAGGIQDAHGVLWQVDLQNMAATTNVHTRKLKRLENLPGERSRLGRIFIALVMHVLRYGG